MIGLDKGTKYVEMYLFRKGPKLGLNAHTSLRIFLDRVKLAILVLDILELLIMLDDKTCLVM